MKTAKPMKKIAYITTALFLSLQLISCQDEEEPVMSFSLNQSEITIGADGGVEMIRITTDGHWMANTEAPWITVSPINGVGTVDCQIQVDTTLLANDIRQGVVRFSSAGQEPLDLRVIQTGYEKMIRLSQTEIEIPNYAQPDKRSFNIELTANVPFDIHIPQEADWLSFDDYNFELNRGSRPRSVKLKVKWGANTRPSVRNALIKFIPSNGDELAAQDDLHIIQEPAEKIEDNRQGDSLAIIGCARSLKFDMGNMEGLPMSKWTFVTIWEPTDKEFTEDKRGRIKAVQFSMFDTDEGIPYEIQYLKKVESITFFSNGNAGLKKFGTGEYISELTQLKELQFISFGLDRIDESFKNLVNLEKLDLTANNFKKVPEILTPENFPKLKELNISVNRCRYVFDLSSMIYGEDEIGLCGTFPEQLLRWEKLETLRLSNNYIYGELPDMEDYEYTYSSEEILQNDTLPNGTNNPAKYNLIGKPKILPNVRNFSINLNLLTGRIPDWILYHPHLMEWDPSILVFPQDPSVQDNHGETTGFSNAPISPNYYYEIYPLKKPDNYDN